MSRRRNANYSADGHYDDYGAVASGNNGRRRNDDYLEPPMDHRPQSTSYLYTGNASMMYTGGEPTNTINNRVPLPTLPINAATYAGLPRTPEQLFYLQQQQKQQQQYRQQQNGQWNNGRFDGLNASSGCCSSRDFGGNDCGQCSFCRSRLVSAQLDLGLNDAWCDIFDHMSNKLAAVEHGIDYGATGAPFTAADVVPGVSQMFVYLAASNPGALDTITVTRLATAADFPLPADLPTGAIMFMAPNGTTVGPNVPRPSFLAITGLTPTALSVVSDSYGIPPVNPPAAAFNGMWQLGATSTTSQTYFRMSTSMYDTSWRIQISNLTVVDAVPPTPPGVSAVYRVASVIASNGSWDLQRTGVREFIAIKRIYLKSFTLCKQDDRCGACHASRGMGCNGTRCRQVKASFRLDFGAKFQSDPTRGELALLNEPGEVFILNGLLNGRRDTKTGLSIDEDTGRLVPKHKQSKDLVQCTKSELKRALRVAREMDGAIESHPGDMKDEYGLLQFEPHRAMDFNAMSGPTTHAKNQACFNNIKQLVTLHKARVAAEKANAEKQANADKQDEVISAATTAAPHSKLNNLKHDEQKAKPAEKTTQKQSPEKVAKKTVSDVEDTDANASVWDGDLFGNVGATVTGVLPDQTAE